MSKRLKKINFLWFFALLIPPLASAQTGLTELLRAASTNHPTVMQANSQYESAGYEVDSAKWGRWPTISSQASAPSSQNQSMTKVEQPLWTAGRITGQIEYAEANQKAALASITDAQTNAMLQVGAAYFDFLRFQQRLEVADKNVKEHQRLADLIGRRVAAEVSPSSDDLLARARLQQANTEKIQIQKARDTAKLSLEQWTNLRVNQVKSPSRIDFRRDPNEDDLVQKAMAFSGQRNKLLHQAEAVSAQLDVIKAQAFPSVVAGVQHVWGGLVPYGYYPHDTGYVALQFQPGAGLSALSARNAASLKKDAAQQELMAFDRTLKNQILTTLSDLESAQSQITPAQLILNGSLDVVASYLRQYQVGRRSWIEVLNAQRELTQAAYSLIDLQVAVQQNQVKLMLLTGDINPQQYDDIHE